MSVYNYVAESNPSKAKKIIDSFGYEVVDCRNLGQSLNELVAQEGEPALKKIMEAHPDKDIILEFFSYSPESNTSCGCKKHNERHNGQYLNASGGGFVDAGDLNNSNSNNNATTLAYQTNAIIIASALFIAAALIIKKN